MLYNSPINGEYSTMYRRNVEAELQAALADTPVVLLNGARQTGKSTLAQDFTKALSVPYYEPKQRLDIVIIVSFCRHIHYFLR